MYSGIPIILNEDHYFLNDIYDGPADVDTSIRVFSFICTLFNLCFKVKLIWILDDIYPMLDPTLQRANGADNGIISSSMSFFNIYFFSVFSFLLHCSLTSLE